MFVAATANRIDALPAELLRKGRFDEVFFVDLPTPSERRQILSVHLRRHDADPAGFALDHLVADTRGWTGAEIAEAVRDAAASLTANPAPCHIDVQAPPELEVTIRVGGARPTRDFPIFLRAGEHRLTVAGLRRSDWLGPIRCEAGARYRVVVR